MPLLQFASISYTSIIFFYACLCMLYLFFMPLYKALWTRELLLYSYVYRASTKYLHIITTCLYNRHYASVMLLFFMHVTTCIIAWVIIIRLGIYKPLYKVHYFTYAPII